MPLKLTNRSEQVLVDEQDLALLEKHRWSYVTGRILNKRGRELSVVLGLGRRVPANGNVFDCRRENLAKPVKQLTSRYKGVSKCGNRWQVTLPGPRYVYAKTEAEAVEIRRKFRQAFQYLSIRAN